MIVSNVPYIPVPHIPPLAVNSSISIFLEKVGCFSGKISAV